MNICVYDSSQSMSSYYAETFQAYGLYIGAAAGTILTPTFLYFGLWVPAHTKPQKNVNYRCLAGEVVVGGALLTPISMIVGRILGSILDYASYRVKVVVCRDVIKNNSYRT